MRSVVTAAGTSMLPSSASFGRRMLPTVSWFAFRTAATTKSTSGGSSSAVSLLAVKNAEAIFAEMAELRSLQGEAFRSAAYAKAKTGLNKWRTKYEATLAAPPASGKPSLEAATVPITLIEELPGVGRGMAAKLLEIESSPQKKVLKDHADLMATDFAVSARFLMSVHGIGPKLAAKLAKETDGKLQRIDQLEELDRAQPDKFTHAQKLGIKYFQTSLQRIPRAEMLLHEALLKKEIAAVSKDLQGEICGSFRRGLPDSGDVDCLLAWTDGGGGAAAKSAAPASKKKGKGTKAVSTLPEDVDNDHHEAAMKQVLERLTEAKYVVGVLAQGPTKLMAYAQLPGGKYPVRRLDIRHVPTVCFATSMLYFTGSGAFNARMRGIALNAGYSLNEYGLFRLFDAQQPPADPNEKRAKRRTSTASQKKGKPEATAEDMVPTSSRGNVRVDTPTEKSVFDVIGMPYVPPTERSE